MLKPFSLGETRANQVEANSDARKTEHIEVELQGEENQLGWRAVRLLGVWQRRCHSSWLEKSHVSSQYWVECNFPPLTWFLGRRD